MVGHGANNDGIEIIDIRNKDVLHTFEQSNQEGTSDVCVHCAMMALSSAAKQNTSCMAHSLCWGNMRSTSARAVTMSSCIFCVEAVLDLGWCMCPLLVAVEQGRWFLISAGVSPGMVASSSLRLSAPRSVADGREHMHWWM